MTRKGFGEMAITACMASPIFNSLFGIGLPVLIKLVRNRKTNPDYVVYFSLYKNNNNVNFLPVSVLHLTLIAA